MADTDQTPVPQLDADTEINLSAPAFDDDPTPPAGTALDDTAPVIIDRGPRAGAPSIRAGAPRRAAFHRAVRPTDVVS